MSNIRIASLILPASRLRGPSDLTVLVRTSADAQQSIKTTNQLTKRLEVIVFMTGIPSDYLENKPQFREIR
jgi:hypothetical protein